MTSCVLSCVNAGSSAAPRTRRWCSGGVCAWYVAFAHVTSAAFGRELIPTWPLR